MPDLWGMSMTFLTKLTSLGCKSSKHHHSQCGPQIGRQHGLILWGMSLTFLTNDCGTGCPSFVRNVNDIPHKTSRFRLQTFNIFSEQYKAYSVTAMPACFVRNVNDSLHKSVWWGVHMFCEEWCCKRPGAFSHQTYNIFLRRVPSTVIPTNPEGKNVVVHVSNPSIKNKSSEHSCWHVMKKKSLVC